MNKQINFVINGKGGVGKTFAREIDRFLQGPVENASVCVGLQTYLRPKNDKRKTIPPAATRITANRITEPVSDNIAKPLP